MAGEIGDQLVLGRVSWRTPPQPQKGGSFLVTVLDKRTHLKAGILTVTSPRPHDVGLGSQGDLQRAADRYPVASGDRRPRGGRHVAGAGRIGVRVYGGRDTPHVRRHLPAAHADPPRPWQGVPTAAVALSDLLVVLVNVGPDGQIYWAERLLG